MDLISLGLKYLNPIIVMAKEVQVRWHKYTYIYMGLDKLKKEKKRKKKKNPGLLPLKLHVYILMRLPFASAASHYWTLLSFTVVVSRDYRCGFYDYINGKRTPMIVIILRLGKYI